MDFARWIAEHDPIICVGHCEDPECFYCGAGDFRERADDVAAGHNEYHGVFLTTIWHNATCPWLLALDECLPADRASHCNACGHEKQAHALLAGACGDECEERCEAFVPPAGRR